MSDTRSREHVSEKAIDARGKEILEKIFKSRDLLLDQQVLSQLKKALPEAKIVDAVFDYYKMRLEKIKAKVNKFKVALLRKYALANLSTRQLIEKAKKYTRKYDLSAGEFQMFINLLLNEPSVQPNQFNIPSTPMSRTLGYNIDATMGDKLVLTDEDMPHFKHIKELHDSTKQLHTQLTLQTLLYTDCNPIALNGKFDSSKHNAFKHVHPIIAALFLPKISFVDEHMLLASISNIIKCKQEGKPITTLPEYELYWDLITDPNQSCVTDERKTMEDLEKRVELQTRLWESVMNLRHGKYYDDDAISFLAAVEKCKNSIFDAPDLVYAHDEGTIFRRLLNVFSFRPTMVNISSIDPTPVMFTTLSIAPTSYSQITSVPMIILRLPRPVGQYELSGSNLTQTINLKDSLAHQQWFIQGKTIVPKVQAIVHSRDVIFFHIDRRFKAYNNAFFNQPHSFAGLPPSLSGLDTVNDSRVEFEQTMKIGTDEFSLRSVVCVDVTSIQNKDKSASSLITGCSTLVITPPLEGGVQEYIRYDPQGAGLNYLKNKPVSAVPTDGQTKPADLVPIMSIPMDTGANDDSFMPYAKHRGTIFVYVKKQAL